MSGIIYQVLPVLVWQCLRSIPAEIYRMYLMYELALEARLTRRSLVFHCVICRYITKASKSYGNPGCTSKVFMSWMSLTPRLKWNLSLYAVSNQARLLDPRVTWRIAG